MKQQDLIDIIARRCAVSKDKAGEAVAELLGAIAGTLTAGETVRLPGIGKLVAKPTQERPGLNPKTGAKITIPAGQRVKFTAAQAMKDALAASA